MSLKKISTAIICCTISLTLISAGTVIPNPADDVFNFFRTRWLNENTDVRFNISPVYRLNSGATPPPSILIKEKARSHHVFIPKYKDGFFCIQERKMEKKSGSAVRIRLGTLEEANRLEGKN